MYDDQTKQHFLELRSQGHSLPRIAKDLQVSRRVLVDWNRQFRHDLRALRAAELEALHERLLASHEADVAALAGVQKKLLAILPERELVGLRTSQILSFYLRYRREIDKVHLAADSLLQPEQAPQSPPAKLQ